jgi:hypothetical protein
MPRSAATVKIRRPADVVFDSLVSHSLRNEPAWEPEVIEVRPLDAGPLHEGSRVAMVRQESGRVSTTTYEIVGLEPPHRLAARHVDGPMPFAIEFVVTPLGSDASTVTVTVDIEPVGPMRLMTPLFALLGPRRNARIARQMAEAIEAATAPTGVAVQTTVATPGAN